MKISRVGIVVGISQSNSVICLKLYEKKIAIKATQVHIKVKIMYFYLLLFFSKAIFWGGEDWDPQKMPKMPKNWTPIWSDMWVPGPRMKNPSAIPVDYFFHSVYKNSPWPNIAVLLQGFSHEHPSHCTSSAGN